MCIVSMCSMADLHYPIMSNQILVFVVDRKRMARIVFRQKASLPNMSLEEKQPLLSS